MSLPPADWYADPRDPGMVRYWDGTAWTAHTQPLLAPTPPPAPQPLAATPGPAETPGVWRPNSPGFEHTATPDAAYVMTSGDVSGGPVYASPSVPPASFEPEGPAHKPSRRGLWWGLGIAGALGLALVAAVVVVLLTKFAPLSNDYTGAPVTASDVAPAGKTVVLSSKETVAVEIPGGWVDAAQYMDIAAMTAGLPKGTEFLGVWFTSTPGGSTSPQLVVVGEVTSEAAGLGSLSDFQKQAIGGVGTSDSLSSVGDTTDVTLANGLEGKRTTVTLDMGNGLTATMTIANFGHGRRFAMMMWTSYSGPVDETGLQALMESLRVDP